MRKLKIAYFSGRMFSDVDLSFLMEAKEMAEIDYYVPIFRKYYKKLIRCIYVSVCFSNFRMGEY